MGSISTDISPKDRFVTGYGRKPVLEALTDERLHPVRDQVQEWLSIPLSSGV